MQAVRRSPFQGLPTRALRGVPLILATLVFAQTNVGAQSTESGELDSYLSANGLLNRGLYDLAIPEYEAFIEGQGGHEKGPIARYGLAVCFYRTGQYKKARATLEAIGDQGNFEFGAEATLLLGNCHLIAKRYDQAAQAFEKLIKEYPKHKLAADSAGLTVEALHRHGAHKQTIAAAKRLARRWPKSPSKDRADYFAGLSEMALEQFEAAAMRFGGILSRDSDASFLAHVDLLLAQCHGQSGAYEQAIHQYRKVIKQGDARFIADARMGLADLLARKQEHAAAGKLLDQLLSMSPGHPLADHARLQRAQVAFLLQEYDQALGFLSGVDPSRHDLSDQVLYWSAKCKLRLQQPEEAAALLAKAITQTPDSMINAEMHYDRAVALIQSDDLEAGVEALISFIDDQPAHQMVPEALYLLAATEHRRKRFDESQAFCAAMLDDHPKHARAEAVAFLQAENEYLSGRFEEASKSYRGFLARFKQAPQGAQARFRLGMCFYQLDRLEEALPILEEVIAGSNDDGYRSAKLALADIHFRRSEWKNAEDRLGQYLDSGLDVPSADDALMKLGLARQRQEKFAAALEAYKQLLQNFAGSRHALHATFETGQLLLALERPDEAVEAFSTVLERGMDSRFAAHALNHLASISSGSGDFAEAAEQFSLAASQSESQELTGEALFQQGQALAAAQKFEEAAEVFDHFMEAHPGHPRMAVAKAHAAIALARTRTSEEALRALQSALKKADKLLSDDMQTALMQELAWCQQAVGNADDAQATYRQLLARGDDLKNSNTLLELAIIHHTKKDPGEAISLLDRLFAVAQQDPDAVSPQVREQALYRLGVCHFELDHFGEAVARLEELLGSFPQGVLTASASFFCGESLFRLGRFEPATARLSHVVQEYPSDASASSSMLRLGECYAAMQRWPQSEQTFASFLKQFSDNPMWFQAQFGLGWARENLQRYEEAITAYRLVVSRHQGQTAARAQFQIGECLFAKKQYGDAVRELLKVESLYSYPEWSAAALYEAGQCFEQQDKRVEAKQRYKEVVERYGDTEWAKLASAKLQRIARQSPKNL